MPTSARNNHCARGFTLPEMLVALAILSFASLIAASAFNARSPRLVVDRTADALLVDLKRIRLLTEMRGTPVELIGSDSGYAAQAANIEARFPKGLAATWNGDAQAILAISSGLGQKGAEIRLAKGGAQAIIEIAPVTGRIRRVR